MKNHGGLIDVESKPDGGTTFRLYFPAASPIAASPAKMIPEPTSETPTEFGRAPEFLLVDDETNMLRVLRKVLLQRGYEVLTAIDGEMALDIYRNHKDTIDAVLLDIGLPKITGRDVLLGMKEQNPNVKVVVASGYLDPQLKSQFYEAGGQDFVQKPYMLDEVVDTLQRTIERRS